MAMSVFVGANDITNGLVFKYDTGNSKSWKGGPLTNYYWNSGSPFSPWTVNGTNTDITGTAEDDGPIPGAKTWRFEKSGTSSQWNGWESTYGGIWTGSSGDIWTTSYWYKTDAPAGNTGFGIGGYYTSDWSRAYNYTVLADRSSIIADGKWHYNYTVTRFNEAYSNAIIVDGPSWGYSSSAGRLYLHGLQWTKAAYASQPYNYVFGTRSNTQSLLDITGKNTITASSLSYGYDGTSVSFDGSTNYVTAGALSGSFSQFTVSVWIYSTSVSNYRNPIDCNFSYNGTTGNIGPRLEQNSSGNLVWAMSGNTGNNGIYDAYTVISSGMAANTWYNVVITRDGSGLISTYLNGAIVTNQASNPNGFVNVFNNVVIGKGFHLDSAATRSFTGNIPLVQIYNRGLTSSEVLQSFNASRTRFGI
jgi:hypothetical protein